jgi:hypothetical protein
MHQANTMRWTVSHLLHTEQWTADMSYERGRYHSNAFAETYAHEHIDWLHADFDQAVAETQAAIATLEDADLRRPVEFIRLPRMSTNYARSLRAVLSNAALPRHLQERLPSVPGPRDAAGVPQDQ